MESKIPLPTDNIYKFYALFGLLLFIFSVGAMLYLHDSTNDFLFNAIVEEERLKAIEKPTVIESAKQKILTRRIEIIMNDRVFFINCLGVLVGIAIILASYGFMKWHREIQPTQDEIMKLQLEKLRREVPVQEAPPTE